MSPFQLEWLASGSRGSCLTSTGITGEHHWSFSVPQNRTQQIVTGTDALRFSYSLPKKNTEQNCLSIDICFYSKTEYSKQNTTNYVLSPSFNPHKNIGNVRFVPYDCIECLIDWYKKSLGIQREKQGWRKTGSPNFEKHPIYLLCKPQKD